MQMWEIFKYGRDAQEVENEEEGTHGQGTNDERRHRERQEMTHEDEIMNTGMED